ncbi:hypothetical protein D3C72_2284370 [compost metagenome]
MHLVRAGDGIRPFLVDADVDLPQETPAVGTGHRDGIGGKPVVGSGQIRLELEAALAQRFDRRLVGRRDPHLLAQIAGQLVECLLAQA